MLGLPSEAGENEIVRHLHNVVGQTDMDKFMTVSSGRVVNDPVARVIARLTEANLIKHSRVYVGASIDPVEILTGMIRNGDKAIIIDGSSQHAVAIVGEVVIAENKSGCNYSPLSD